MELSPTVPKLIDDPAEIQLALTNPKSLEAKE